MDAGEDEDDEFEDVDDGDDEDDEAMFNASTALAIEKECAADAISEIFSSVKAPFLPYVETVVRALLPGLKHGWHDGIRKSAAAALLNFITTFHEMSEAPKWTKGSGSVSPRLFFVLCADSFRLLSRPTSPRSRVQSSPVSLRCGTTRRTGTSSTSCVCRSRARS